MKKIFAVVFSLCLGIFGIQMPVSAFEDSHFESFVADYYLSRDEDGVSRMKVVEKINVEFLTSKHGLVRYIPFTNQNGKNLTVENARMLDVSIKRNGADEPFIIDKGSDYFNLKIGDANKTLTGKQVYTLEYEFVRVATEFESVKYYDSPVQEIYWDTNGTGWDYGFDKVTARLHLGGLADNLISADEVTGLYHRNKSGAATWCYVGRYGENGQERCEISRISDGLQFSADNLSAGENITFVASFKDGTFEVPPVQKNYVAVNFAIALFGACLILSVIYFFVATKDGRKNKRALKSRAIVVQYQPMEMVSPAQMGMIYLGDDKKLKNAALLNMLVKKQVEITKGEKKLLGGYRWNLKVLSLEGTSEEEKDLLSLLKGGGTARVGDSFELKKHSYSSSLERAYRNFSSDTSRTLRVKQMLKKEKTSSWTGALILLLFFVPMGILILYTIVVEEYSGFGEEVCMEAFPISIMASVAMVIIVAILSSRMKRIGKITETGLETYRYAEGLKKYVKMAETERIKFLQSVEGADTSSSGVVKLYEKLLPYAALFGLEKSWMDALGKYYDAAEEPEPSWYGAGFNMAVMSSVMSSAAAKPVDPSSSSSSSSSGGGGGGFSGGGGGGGGGGTW